MRTRPAILVLALLLGSLLPVASRADSSTQTRHPIVLVHGLFGHEQRFGTTALRAGGAVLLVARLSPADDTAEPVEAPGQLVSLFAGSSSPIDRLAAAQSLSSTGSQAFDRCFLQGEPSTPCGHGAAVVGGVRHHAFGGRSVATNALDATDAMLVGGSLAFGQQASDGLVSPCSSSWGKVIRDDLPSNHFDQVNQSFGLRGLFTPDPVAVHRSHANRLKRAGL